MADQQTQLDEDPSDHSIRSTLSRSISSLDETSSKASDPYTELRALADAMDLDLQADSQPVESPYAVKTSASPGDDDCRVVESEFTVPTKSTQHKLQAEDPKALQALLALVKNKMAAQKNLFWAKHLFCVGYFSRGFSRSFKFELVA